MTETLGKYIGSCRQTKGLTVEEIAQITRINVRFIQAAEADRFDQLPGSVFIKGFLRSYAEVVRVDGADLVKRYDNLGLVEADKSPKLISMPLHEDSTRLSALALVGSIVVALVFLGLYFSGVTLNVEWPDRGQERIAAVKQASKEVSPVEPASRASMETESADDDVKDKGETDKNGEKRVEKEEKEATTGVVNVEKETSPSSINTAVAPPLSLKVIADSNSWIKIVIDEETTKEIILREGKSVTWMAENGYKISIGNVAGTRLFLNGEEIRLVQPFSNVLTDLIVPNRESMENSAEKTR